MTHDLLDDDLRSELRRLADVGRAPMREDPVALVERRVRARDESRRIRRRIRTGAVMVAMLGVAATLVVFAVVSRHDASPPVRVATEPVPSEAPGAGVQVLEAGPLSPRVDAAVVGSGSTLFVWGGTSPAGNFGRQFADGAIYDSKTGRWSKLATSPFPSSIEVPIAVGTPDGAVVAQGRFVAVWHSATNTWTRLDDAPARVRDLVWATGPVLSASANASLDPRTGTWTAIAARPSGIGSSPSVWTGTELLVFGTQDSGAAIGAAYSPDDDRWRMLAPPSDLTGNGLAAAYDGHDVVAVDYELHAAAYSPTLDRWRALADVPAAFFEWYPKLRVSSSSTLTAFMGNAVVIRPRGGDWIPVPYAALSIEPGKTPSGAPAVVAEDRSRSLLVFGIGADAQNVLVRVWPDRIRSAVTRVSVGNATVQLSDGFRYVEGGVTLNATGSPVGVLVVIDGPSGRCGVSSITGPSAIRPANGRWSRNGDGDQGWRRELVGQEVLTVKCASPEAADVILDRIEVPDR